MRGGVHQNSREGRVSKTERQEKKTEGQLASAVAALASACCTSVGACPCHRVTCSFGAGEERRKHALMGSLAQHVPAELRKSAPNQVNSVMSPRGDQKFQ